MELSKEDIIITRFTKQDKPSLKAFLSIEIPKYSGMCVNDISYFEKGDQRWISYPQKQYEKDGQKKYTNMIFFKERSAQNAIIQALDDYFKKNDEKLTESGFIPF